MNNNQKNTGKSSKEKLKTVERRCEENVKKMKEQFQQLSRRLLEDQERERNAIGRELHDEVGGYLTILGIYLSKMTKEPENKAWLEQFTKALNDMVQYVRSLSHSLYPVMLERGDLTAAIVAYIDNYQRRTGIKANFNSSGLKERLPSHIEAVVYRIIQEALTNVAKHATAETVNINIVKLKRTIKISIEDNGCGFDISKVLPAKAYGISGMKNRALFAGGTLDIDSKPGKGTVVSATLPLDELKQT